VSRTPTGLVPILATPFTSGGEVDRASLRSLVEFQLSCGVDGVAVFGMASEGFALTAAERAVILRDVRAVAGPDVPIVAGVNGTGTAPALEQARAAAEGGADQVMVLPPFLAKPAPGQVAEFFTDVAAGAGVPVMIQDAPGVTGVTIAPETITDLAAHPMITSVKIEAPPTPVKIAAVTGGGVDHLAVLGGQNAQAVLEEYGNGAVGTMPACEFADVLRNVLDEHAAGRYAEARAGFARLMPLIQLGTRPGQAWAVHKEVLVRRGVIASGTVRLPARPLDPVTARALDDVLADLPLAPRR